MKDYIYQSAKKKPMAIQHFRLSEEDMGKVKELAEKYGVTMSAIIRGSIELFYDKFSDKNE